MGPHADRLEECASRSRTRVPEEVLTVNDALAGAGAGSLIGTRCPLTHQFSREDPRERPGTPPPTPETPKAVQGEATSPPGLSWTALGERSQVRGGHPKRRETVLTAGLAWARSGQLLESEHSCIPLNQRMACRVLFRTKPAGGSAPDDWGREQRAFGHSSGIGPVRVKPPSAVRGACRGADVVPWRPSIQLAEFT